MRSLMHFLQYNNAVPVALGALFLGASATFAMTNPDAVYSEDVTVLSIDNTYIAQKTLDDYTPQVQITNVTEDDEYYYVEYQLTTIMLQESVWQDVNQDKALKVSKADLGEYRDLGLYVSEQLKQLIDREVVYLKEVQEFEKSNITQKTVATKYGGLVGKLLDDTTEELPGYTPVVEAEDSEGNELLAESRENARTDALAPPEASQQTKTSTTQTQTTQQETSAPTISFQILGDNPVHIDTGDTYSDLGVIVIEDGRIVGYSVQTFVDDEEVSRISVDTDDDAQYTITYRTSDGDGHTAEATRIVIVGEGEQEELVTEPETEEESATTTETTDTSTTSTTTTAQATTTESVATTTEEVVEDTATTTTEESEEQATDDESVSTTTEEVVQEPEPQTEEVVEESGVEAPIKEEEVEESQEEEQEESVVEPEIVEEVVEEDPELTTE